MLLGTTTRGGMLELELAVDVIDLERASERVRRTVGEWRHGVSATKFGGKMTSQVQKCRARLGRSHVAA